MTGRLEAIGSPAGLIPMNALAAIHGWLPIVGNTEEVPASLKTTGSQFHWRMSFEEKVSVSVLGTTKWQ
jgi:hypothetical protein